MKDTEEDLVWYNINPDHIWVLDKLILSKKLGYICGPTGIDVPKPGWYVVRPCVNAMGLGLGAKKVFIERETMHLPIGHFWCEWFEGRHYSVDYWPKYGTKVFTIEGIKSPAFAMYGELVKWEKWIKVKDKKEHVIPDILYPIIQNYYQINLEFIGNKPIEVHLRPNEDFREGKATKEFIPVWEDQKIIPPKGYRYIEYADVNGRIGAYVK